MRAIKFRAWDFDKNKMFYDYELDKPNMIDFNGNVYKTGNTGKMCEYGCSAEYINKAENCVLMQFTGYKDRNGREVYEGDIYAMEEYRHGEKTVTYWTVIWDETEYGFSLVANIEKSYRGEKYREDVYLPLRFIDGNKMEYTGNIYENPELLEG